MLDAINLMKGSPAEPFVLYVHNDVCKNAAQVHYNITKYNDIPNIYVLSHY
jgi:hypothetical protein